MKWTRPGIRRHFDFQGADEKRFKRYIITLKVTNKDREHNIAVIHVPFQQDGWSMMRSDLPGEITVEGLEVREREEAWRYQTHAPDLEGEQKGLWLYSHTHRMWGAYLEPDETATITFQALVTSDRPLADQTLTLSYFPDLGWPYSESERTHQPILKPSPYYSSNLELEKGHLA